MTADPSAVMRGRLLILAASVLWSLSGAFTCFLSEETFLGLNVPRLDPLKIAACRVFFAAAVLATLVRPADISFRPVLLLNGLAFAVITGVAAYAWFKVPGLGFVIGLAMICNLVAAALGGILIPLTLHRLGRDPAVASSPFVTTVTDVVGFFSFLGIATIWFGLK